MRRCLKRGFCVSVATYLTVLNSNKYTQKVIARLIMKKEEQEPQAEPVEPADEPKAAKPKSNQFTVSDQGEHGYDNDGPFGIGMIKGVK